MDVCPGEDPEAQDSTVTCLDLRRDGQRLVTYLRVVSDVNLRLLGIKVGRVPTGPRGRGNGSQDLRGPYLS